MIDQPYLPHHPYICVIFAPVNKNKILQHIQNWIEYYKVPRRRRIRFNFKNVISSQYRPKKFTLTWIRNKIIFFHLHSTSDESFSTVRLDLFATLMNNSILNLPTLLYDEIETLKFQRRRWFKFSSDQRTILRTLNLMDLKLNFKFLKKK